MTPSLEAKLFAGMRKTPNAIMVQLPWPEKVLSPNARCHWAVKAAAVSRARKAARLLTLQQTGRRKVAWGRAHLTWEFCPPSRRRFDVDNLVGQHKAANDGIADALGLDDSTFISTYRMAEPVKGGAVIVTIKEA